MMPGLCRWIPIPPTVRRTITADGFTCANTNRITMARSHGSRAGCPARPSLSVFFFRFEFFADLVVKPPCMGWRKGIFLMALLLGGAQWVQAEPGYSVEIDLEQQTAYLIRGRHVVLASPIS